MATQIPEKARPDAATFDYDVIIIGGGPGGYNAAIRAGQLGLTVACVESRETLGGTCLNVGCIPSKALLHASDLFEVAGKGFAALGIKIPAPELDLPQMHKQKDESVTALTKGIEFLFKKNKVEWIKGAGAILAPGQVLVRGGDGDERTFSARNIVIATGSAPSRLPGVKVDQIRIVDSTGALALSSTPVKLVVIGAGIIGLEIGSVWRRLGAEVEVVEFLDRTIPGADVEVATAFQRALTKQGIKFRFSTRVTGAQVGKDGVVLCVEPVMGGAAEAIMTDVVLVAIGRRPVTDGLGLEEIGVKTNPRGFVETNHYKTNVEGIWAIGDVTNGPMLAHKAEEEAVACIELIAGKAGHVNYDVIPGVIYTSPEVAWVGKSEEDLNAAGVAYKVGRFPFTANSRAKVNHEAEGFVKVLADAKTDRILGAHLIGPTVSEMIGEYCVAMEFAAGSEDIARTCHPHPTKSEALRQAAMGVGGWTMQS